MMCMNPLVLSGFHINNCLGSIGAIVCEYSELFCHEGMPKGWIKNYKDCFVFMVKFFIWDDLYFLNYILRSNN